jgi:hypothetical protein
MIGIYEGSVKQIIETKTFDPQIKWIEPETLSKYAADPFIIEKKDGKIKVLFEEFILKEDYGKISLLTLNKDFQPIKSKVLLDTNSHLSYPFIFEEQGIQYVFPEAAQSGKLCCYQYDPIKEELFFKKDILDLPLLDSTIIKHHQKYWLFTTTGSNNSEYQLHLFFAAQLCGPYFPHSENPVKTGINGIRSAGNFLKINDDLYWPTQNCKKKYGDSITFNKINILTEKEFKDEPVFTISIERLNTHERVASIHTINELQNMIILDAQRWSFSPYRQLCKFYKDNFKKS